MTFAHRNLSVLACAHGFTHWSYKDLSIPLGEMRVPGFFDPAGEYLASGDMVMVSARDSGCILYVAEGLGSRVTMAPLQ